MDVTSAQKHGMSEEWSFVENVWVSPIASARHSQRVASAYVIVYTQLFKVFQVQITCKVLCSKLKNSHTWIAWFIT